ncbi:MAG: NTPase [Candidatus Odinarchaeia archaeon]
MLTILITGPPKSGKTTLIREIINEIPQQNIIGFYTEEIREKGMRVGFKICSLNGQSMILATVKENFQPKIGKYSVYVKNVNRLVKNLETELNKKHYKLIIIDEIGKMELLSNQFKNFIRKLIRSNNVLGTIKLHDCDFTRKIKSSENVKIHYLNKSNKNTLKTKILQEIKNLI